MAKIRFRKISLSKSNKEKLNQINDIISEYQEDGYVLTLRQLYYQLVTRDIIPNIQSEYAKLSKLLKEGRMAGIVDWDAIEDRLRKPSSPASWSNPKSILNAALNQYQKPRMDNQKNYLEVWVEKDALSGVLKRITEKYHVPIMINRGYSSVSAMFDSYERFKTAFDNSQKIKILYLGDYDPSGIDMIRDIRDRIKEFFTAEDFKKELLDNFEYKNNDEYNIFLDSLDKKYNDDLETIFSENEIHHIAYDEYFEKWFQESFIVEPIALTRNQIDLYKPPPNPAKKTDPRAKDFIKKFGATSWEVDALPPQVLNEILESSIVSHVDLEIYNKIVDSEKADKEKIKKLIDKI